MAAVQSWSSKPGSASRWLLVSTICVASVLAGLLGCSSGGELPERVVDSGPPLPANSEALRLPFLVDDHFVPNGCFGDANCQGDVIAIDNRACTTRQPTVQSVCRRFTYVPLASETPEYEGYLGILFQSVGALGEHRIGWVPGVPVQPGAARVVFWAAVGAGSVDVAFRAGGANNWEGETDPSLPYRDDFGVRLDVTLTTEYQHIELDLSRVTYENVVSPFGWSISSRGRTEPIDLFIDDLRWE